MTVAELNDLLARGAAQPGVGEAQEIMRLSLALEKEARQLAELYAAPPSVGASSSTMAPRPIVALGHADLG